MAKVHATSVNYGDTLARNMKEEKLKTLVDKTSPWSRPPKPTATPNRRSARAGDDKDCGVMVEARQRLN